MADRRGVRYQKAYTSSQICRNIRREAYVFIFRTHQPCCLRDTSIRLPTLELICTEIFIAIDAMHKWCSAKICKLYTSSQRPAIMESIYSPASTRKNAFWWLLRILYPRHGYHRAQQDQRHLRAREYETLANLHDSGSYVRIRFLRPSKRHSTF